MKWYLKVLKNYANFNGRARRMEYWMFVLFNIIFLFVAMALDNILGLNLGGSDVPYGPGPIYLIYVIAMIIPSLAVAVRRLQDSGRTGWMILVGLIPIIGGIWLLILLLQDSTPEENKYGPNPKEVIS